MGLRAFAAMLLGVLLPASATKNRLLGLLVPSWKIHPGASLNHVLLIDVQSMEVAATARVGTFTTVRGLRRLELHGETIIGSWNWITTAPPLHGLSETAGTLVVGEGSIVTSRHYLDCSGGIVIGRYGGLAGIRSTVLTHGVDFARGVQTVGRVTLGDFSLLSSNCNVTAGTTVPDHCLIGMGSTVLPGLAKPYSLYAGSPAKFKRELPPESGFFTRTESVISPPPADAD